MSTIYPVQTEKQVHGKEKNANTISYNRYIKIYNYKTTIYREIALSHIIYKILLRPSIQPPWQALLACPGMDL